MTFPAQRIRVRHAEIWTQPKEEIMLKSNSQSSNQFGNKARHEYARDIGGCSVR
jgi:hypothetical protein